MREILIFSSCALPELWRVSAINVNKLTDYNNVVLSSSNDEEESHPLLARSLLRLLTLLVQREVNTSSDRQRGGERDR